MKENYISAEEQLFKVPYKALGQEVYDEREEEPSPYSAREMARLWSFEHAHRQANELEKRLESGKAQEYWWIPEDKSQSKSLLWKESYGMLHSMREMTLNMYTGHMMEDENGDISHIPGFIDEPKMKIAADQLLNQIHQEKVDVDQFERLELAAMWDSS